MTDHQTVNFAAEEMISYLNKMGNVLTFSNIEHDISIGVYEDHGIKTNINNPLDDEVYIDISDGKGYISGPNPRSVLLSTYRYLTECGCRFLHPSSEGEVIPTKTSLKDIKIKESPSYRYRGISMEGSMSIENLIDFIDWLPKVGMNSYHTQLKDGYTFFDRWYSHKYNPLKTQELFDTRMAEQYMSEALDHIKTRDLIHQTMGHGLTCEPFGIQGLGWDRVHFQPPEEIKPFLAEINGERKFWRGIPVNTNACYSNPEVRKRIIDYIATYCKDNPHVDLFHFWLADDLNNHCECKNCVKRRPSDWYVCMLNELDELLTEQNIQVKIVFLLFYELLWPPQNEEFNNQDRFILLFAPLARPYNESFKIKNNLTRLPEFKRNNIFLAENPDEDFAFLKAWRDKFQGDSFIFIYHLMTTGWEKDIGGYKLAKILHGDMKTYETFNLNGVSSCQTQRMFFPTSLPMIVMAKMMWDNNQSFDVISNQYFLDAYGDEGAKVEQFISHMSNEFNIDYLQLKLSRRNNQYAVKFAEIPNYIRGFMPVIERNLGNPDKCINMNWHLLHIYSILMIECAKMFQSIANGESEKVASKIWPDFLKTMFKYEDILENVFDIEWFARNFKLYQIDESHFTNYE